VEEGSPVVAVRRAGTGDLPGIVRLWREMWDFHTPLDARFEATPAADSVMRGWIEENLTSERSAVFVAESGGALQGYCLGMILENPPVLPHQFYGYVSEISVRPKRKGVGRGLLEAIHGWFRSHRLPYVEVNVSVRNDVARRFWRKNGYGEFLERLRHEL
jgi:ribosomal protein S18 acetylase RimI-like enzyme